MSTNEEQFQQYLAVCNAIAWLESKKKGNNNMTLQSQRELLQGNPIMTTMEPYPTTTAMINPITVSSAYLLQQKRQIEAELMHSRATVGSADQLLQDFYTRQRINAMLGKSQTWNNIDLSRSLLPHEMDIQTAISQARMMLERNTSRPLPQLMGPIQESGERMTHTIPLSLPTCLARSIDKFTMTAHQFFLRQQIEVFQANEEDVSSHIRGRNKPILLGQVGIRCRHCAHVPVMRRQKGSTYYPSNKYGIYQAAQNMSSSHLQCGLCSEMPASVKMQFARILMENTHSSHSRAGRPYWAESATQLGLVDTEDAGIRFISDQRKGLN